MEFLDDPDLLLSLSGGSLCFFHYGSVWVKCFLRYQINFINKAILHIASYGLFENEWYHSRLVKMLKMNSFLDNSHEIRFFTFFEQGLFSTITLVRVLIFS